MMRAFGGKIGIPLSLTLLGLATDKINFEPGASFPRRMGNSLAPQLVRSECT